MRFEADVRDRMRELYEAIDNTDSTIKRAVLSARLLALEWVLEE